MRLQTLRPLGCVVVLFFALETNAQTWSLDDLLVQAISTYPAIRSRMASKDAADSDLTSAKLRFLPTPTVSTQRNRVAYQGQSANALPATTLTLSQPVFMGGGLIAGYDKAKSQATASDFAVREAAEDVGRRLVTMYSEWLRARLKVIAMEESVSLHEKLVGLISRRYQAGVASLADRDLGVSRLHQAQATLDSQRSQEATALTSISELVGQQVDSRMLKLSTDALVTLPKRNDGINKALDINPTISRLKHEADAAEADARVARAQALPQVSLQAQRQIGNAYTPGWPGYDMVGLVVQLSPGAGLSTVSGISAAYDRAKAALLQVDTTKRDVTDKLNSDYNEMESSWLKRDSFAKAVNLATDVSASYDRQYLVGRKSWLDLMNAVRERADTRMSLADAEASLLAANRRLGIYIEGLGAE